MRYCSVRAGGRAFQEKKRMAGDDELKSPDSIEEFPQKQLIPEIRYKSINQPQASRKVPHEKIDLRHSKIDVSGAQTSSV